MPKSKSTIKDGYALQNFRMSEGMSTWLVMRVQERKGIRRGDPDSPLRPTQTDIIRDAIDFYEGAVPNETAYQINKNAHFYDAEDVVLANCILPIDQVNRLDERAAARQNIKCVKVDQSKSAIIRSAITAYMNKFPTEKLVKKP